MASLVNLALAGFEESKWWSVCEEDSISADFLRRHSLDRLPNNPKLRERAVEFLRKQGKRRIWRGKWKSGGNKCAK